MRSLLFLGENANSHYSHQYWKSSSEQKQSKFMISKLVVKFLHYILNLDNLNEKSHYYIYLSSLMSVEKCTEINKTLATFFGTMNLSSKCVYMTHWTF